MIEAGEYSPSPTAGEQVTTTPRKKKSKNNNKRRFSDEQIRSLELMFENETRLEPRKKVQLARDLGLQPRQVAIWFQNKRARWKSKTLERDYNILEANYNNLASKFETLKKEKQSLLAQLNDLLHQNPRHETGQPQPVNSVCSELDNGNHGVLNPTLPFERSQQQRVGAGAAGVLSDDDIDSSINTHYFGLQQQPNLITMVEPAESSLTSPEDWGNFHSDHLFHQSSGGYQWWDFWS